MKKETQPRTWYKGPPAPQGAAASGAPRTWHSGPPPHVGWWNASIARQTRAWRWWDGIQWSKAAEDQEDAQQAREWALGLYPGSPHSILWTNYYPKNARVPRVDPADPLIMPLLPKMNAGDSGAWFLAGHLSPHPAEPDPTPEEDEAWRAISTGQAQNPGARDLAEVSTRDLMTELFRRVG